MSQQNSKAVAISELTRELKEREREAMRLREAIGRIAALEGEISTLQASLKLLQGHAETGESAQPHLFNHSKNGSSSLSSVVYSILKQANRPLGAGEVVTLGAAHGKTINYQSLTSMMSEKINAGKLFYREGTGRDGKYGLLEWKDGQVEPQSMREERTLLVK